MKFAAHSLAARIAFFLDSSEDAQNALDTFADVCAFLDAAPGARWHGVAL